MDMFVNVNLRILHMVTIAPANAMVQPGTTLMIYVAAITNALVAKPPLVQIQSVPLAMAATFANTMETPNYAILSDALH